LLDQSYLELRKFLFTFRHLAIPDLLEEQTFRRLSGLYRGSRLTALDDEAAQAEIKAALQFFAFAMAIEAIGFQDGPNMLLEINRTSRASPGWLIDTASLGPEATLERAEQRELIWRLVDALPDEKREVVQLVYEAEMELRQVASTLGVPEGTVKSRLHYAMKRLAREWKELALEWEES
jgi:RNA polymerase sigma factor (sigma-70 family)